MTKPTAGYQRLFAELKRRHVFKVAAIYGAVAFAVLQIADPLGKALGLPDSFLTLVVALLMLGFPVALVLAWAFEVTPEGVQKTESAAPGEIEAIVAQPASKRWPAGLLALGGIVLLFGGGWWMGQRSADRGPLDLGVPEAQAADFAVVAVLPFDNVGGGTDDAVLASGLEYDLHENLGRLASLRAIAPGSVQEYRTTTKADDEIADELGADYLLRGSILRAGSRVRVNVQLIDAGTTESLWGERFERAVSSDNLFEIQSEIAASVAREIATRLSPDDVATLETRPASESSAALAAYNRGRQVYNTPAPGETWLDALEHVERAVNLDPEFVEAWSFLARLSALVSQGDTTHRARARDAVVRVETLAPESPEAISARAFLTYYVDREFESALQQLERAEELAPSDVDVASGLAYLNRRLGRWAASLEAFKTAISLDPRSAHLLDEYRVTLLRLGRLEAADAVAEKALQVSPGDPATRAGKVRTSVHRFGDVERARGLAGELGLNPGDPIEAQTLALLSILERDYDAALRLAVEMPARDEFDDFVRFALIGWVRLLRGEDAAAIGDSLAEVLPSAATGIAQQMAGVASIVAGDTAEAWGRMEAALRHTAAEGDRWSAAEIRTQIAASKALVGDPDGALDALEDIVEMPGAEISWNVLRLDPILDGLRDDPRFDELLERRREFEERAAREAEADRPWLP